jgi:hypothetical protein
VAGGRKLARPWRSQLAANVSYRRSVPSAGIGVCRLQEALQAVDMSCEPSEPEAWESLLHKLRDDLTLNPLDVENPPTEKPKGDDPDRMVFSSSEKGSEENPDGKNTVSLLNAIKKWELELPNMVLLVHGGSAHPLQLIQPGANQVTAATLLLTRPSSC